PSLNTLVGPQQPASPGKVNSRRGGVRYYAFDRDGGVRISKVIVQLCVRSVRDCGQNSQSKNGQTAATAQRSADNRNVDGGMRHVSTDPVQNAAKLGHLPGHAG